MARYRGNSERSQFPPLVNEKECRCCHVVKPASEFAVNRNSKDRLQSYCYVCMTRSIKEHARNRQAALGIDGSKSKLYKAKRYRRSRQEIRDRVKERGYKLLVLFGNQEYPARWISERTVALAFETLKLSVDDAVELTLVAYESRYIPAATPERAKLIRQFLDERQENISQGAAKSKAPDPRYLLQADGTKTCRRCQKDQTDQDFGKNKARPDGLMAECRECVRVYNKAWAAKQAA